MKVAAAIVCVGILFGLSEAVPLSQIFGPCIEACFILQADGEVGSCPVGYECRSNGCGHTCHKVVSGVVECPLLKCLDIECPLGYQTDENGCQTCSCRSLVQVQ